MSNTRLEFAPNIELTTTIMANQPDTPENVSPRRRFLLGASLATAALGMNPLTGMGVPARVNPARADAPGKLCLWSDRPAQTWMTEAYPQNT